MSNELLFLFKSRKKLISFFAIFEALMYIPITLIFLLGTFKPFYLLIFVSLYWVFGRITNPSWNSWMGDLVDSKNRGKYFGIRYKFTGMSTFLSYIVAGLILNQANFFNNKYLGFAIIFSLAFLSRILSLYFLLKKYEPSYDVKKNVKLGFKEFLSYNKYREYRKLVFYLGFISFAVYISSPFFVSYMLNDLKMSYIIFTIVNATSIIAKYLTMSLWGSACDKYGSKKIISFASIFLPIIPVLWIISGNLFYLLVIQFFAGIIWAAYEISAFNYLYNLTDRRTRTRLISFNNVINGIGLFLGPMIGAIIVKYNTFFWSKHLFVFLISGIARSVVALWFLPKLQEPRKVKTISYHRLAYNVLSTMPTMGIINRLITFRRKVVKK